jgi:putative peptidoglycan lipid II flippase
MKAPSVVWWRRILPCWWLALAIGSHWPKLDLSGMVGMQNDSLAFGVDKWVHVAAYLGLAWLALSARLFVSMPRAWRIVVTVETLVLYLLIDETTQVFSPGRSLMLSDVGASATGVAIGTALWAIGRWMSDHDGSFVAHTRIVSLLTLVSRLFGLVRDWALAWVFGFGWVYDAFVIAFMIPNLFRRLFGEGALAAAFVPQYTRLRRTHDASAHAFATRVLWRITIALTGITLITVAALITIDLSATLSQRADLTVKLTTITLWYAPLVCGAAILGAILQVHGRFGPPAAAPVILNLFIIGACFVAGYAMGPEEVVERRIMTVCIAVVIAGIVQVAWQAALRPKAAAEDRPQPALVDDAMGRLMRQWVPTVVGLAVFQVNVLADSLIAWFFSAPPGAAADATMHLFGWHPQYPMQTGAVSVLGATARLYEFPIGVFGIAVATAIFPQLASAAEDRERFTDLLHRGLRLTILIGLPASVGLVLIREPLATAIYYRGGKLTADDAARIAWVLGGYAPAVWAYSMNHLLTRTFYAHQNTLTPMRVAVSMVALNVTLNLLLIWPLGAAGLAWSTAICAAIQSVILLRLVRRYVDRPLDGGVLASWVRSGIVTAVMAAVLLGVLGPFDLATMSRWEVIGLLIGATGAGTMAVAAAAWILKMPEIRWILSRRGM